MFRSPFPLFISSGNLLQTPISNRLCSNLSSVWRCQYFTICPLLFCLKNARFQVYLSLSRALTYMATCSSHSGFLGIINCLGIMEFHPSVEGTGCALFKISEQVIGIRSPVWIKLVSFYYFQRTSNHTLNSGEYSWNCQGIILSCATS